MDEQAKLLVSSSEIRSKSDALTVRLLEVLGSSQFSLGSQFYTLQEVSKRFDISIGTARKAISDLVDRGWLEPRHGSGHYVSRIPSVSTPHSPPVCIGWVMVVIEADPNSVSIGYFRELQAACRRAGYSVEIVSNDSATLADRIDEEEIKGIIAFDLDRKLAIDGPIDIPVVSFGHQRVCDQQITVAADVETGISLSFNRLFELGHQAVLLLVHDTQGFLTRGGDECVLGMRKAFVEAGREWHADHILSVDQSDLALDGMLIRRLIDEGVTGIVVPQWPLPIQLYQQSLAQGIEVGREISLIAVGNHPITEHLQPAITRIGWDPKSYADCVVKTIARGWDPDQNDAMSTFRIPVFMVEGASVFQTA